VRNRLTFGLLALPLLIAAASHVAGQDLAADRANYVSKKAFFIPFATDHSNGRVIELRLYASHNSGPWVLTGKAKPEQKGFEFRTDQDGPFAFAVQAVKAGEILDPPLNDLRASLRVVIDTQKPQATLRGFVEQGGAAGVEWNVTDDNLDPNSIRLEYRWPDQPAWLPLDKDVAFKARDQRTWDLKPGQKLEVRLRAADLAKNEFVSPGVWAPPERGAAASSFSDNARDPGAVQPGGPSRPTMFHVNKNQVRLEYDVKVGPSGLHKVELWYTTNGQEWKLDEKTGGDAGPDAESPPPAADEGPGKRSLVFQADKDGLYGFIIIARNRVGLGPEKPKRGDAAQVQVMVDTTKPTVRLLDVKVRPGGERGAAVLDILWDAKDANIAPQPIYLEFAEKAEGPWRTIADKLDNTGRFTWTVGPNEPYQFFVRVRCVDRAQNIGEDATPKPVIVDLTVPSVEIKDVGPGGR
jgi:hypothetical protein